MNIYSQVYGGSERVLQTVNMTLSKVMFQDTMRGGQKPKATMTKASRLEVSSQASFVQDPGLGGRLSKISSRRDVNYLSGRYNRAMPTTISLWASGGAG